MRQLLLLCTLLLLLSGCKLKPNQPTGHLLKGEDGSTYVADTLTVYCDETFRYLMDQEVTIYEHIYPGKKVLMVYATEAAVLHHLLDDSFSCVIIGRRLRLTEAKAAFTKTNLQVEEHIFAKDAVALLHSDTYHGQEIDTASLRAMLSGGDHSYTLVFGGGGTGIIHSICLEYGISSMPSGIYAIANRDSFLAYMTHAPQAIGFVPYQWLSDEDNPKTKELLKNVKLVYLTYTDTAGEKRSTTACESDIADGSYPFCRPINFVAHTMDEIVGTGFVNFLYGERAGRIALKSGLIPTLMPQRVVTVRSEGLKTN